MSDKNKIEYDRSQWAHGEWDSEPDRVDFIHEGFACFIQRNHTGNWCGYVGVPREHPLYEVDCDDFNVHGGITFQGHCSGAICHVPEPGMPDDVWWFGFDTAHYMDLSPSIEFLVPGVHGDGDVYRNQAYVTEETKNLAEQLRKKA